MQGNGYSNFDPEVGSSSAGALPAMTNPEMANGGLAVQDSLATPSTTVASPQKIGFMKKMSHGTENLARATVQKLDHGLAFGLSKLDKLLDDGSDGPRLVVLEGEEYQRYMQQTRGAAPRQQEMKSRGNDIMDGGSPQWKKNPVAEGDDEDGHGVGHSHGGGHDDHHHKDLTSEMVEKAINSGQYKVNYAIWQNMINGTTGGAFIAIGAFFSSVVAGGLPGIKKENPGLAKLIQGLTFPIGLFLVTLSGAELVTSNFSTVGAACLAGTLRGKNRRAMFNICLIYTFNFLGSLLVAGLAYGTGVFDKDPWLHWFQDYAEHKVHQPMGQAFVKGIVCNWLVSLATLLTFSSDNVVGKAVALWPYICGFVTMGMDHCVANMFFLPLGMWLGAHYSTGEMFVNNLIPVTFGNLIGSQMCSIVYNLRFRQTFWNQTGRKMDEEFKYNSLI